MESTAAPSRRIAPAWIGPGLLALWLGAMVPALARLETGGMRASPASDSAALLAALRARVDIDRHRGTAVVFHLRSACACNGAEDEDARRVRDAVQARRIRWVELPGVADAELPHSLMALDADGHLRYAGPARPADLCAGPAPAPLATRYLSFHREDAPRALVSESACPCR